MISPTERKKSSFAKALLPSFGAEMKKYEEIYQVFAEEGYTKNLCEQYADAFVDNAKKPAVEDILQLVELYDRIHDLKNAQFYLEMLAEKKLSGDDKFAYCVASLKVLSKLGQWRDAEDFRTAGGYVPCARAHGLRRKALHAGFQAYEVRIQATRQERHNSA